MTAEISAQDSVQALRYVEALLDAMEAAIRDDTAVWRHSTYKQFARKYMDVVTAIAEMGSIAAPISYYDLEKIPGSGDTVAAQQREIYEGVRANLHILKAYLVGRGGLKNARSIELAEFFATNLRRAVLDVPEREKDIQNVMEQLLIGRGLQKGSDYDREVGRVKVSIKEVVPDFIVHDLNLAIEVKFARDKVAAKAIIDEINADIQSYGMTYDSLLFVVYDVGGSIRDESEFRRDLEASGSVRVVVVKH